MKRKADVLTLDIPCERAPAGDACLDKEGCFSFVGRSFAGMFDKVQEDLLGRHWRELIHPMDREESSTPLKSMSNEGPAVLECRFEPDGGAMRCAEFAAIPTYDAGGRFSGHRCSLRDITPTTTDAEMSRQVLATGGAVLDELAMTRRELRLQIASRQRAEHAHEESERRFNSLYQNAPVMLFTLDAEGTILAANRCAAGQLGFGERELLGQSFLDLHLDREKATIEAHLEKCMRRPGSVHRYEIRRLRNDGTVVWVRENMRTVEDASGVRTCLTAGENVTETHELSQKLSYLETHDALTGLVNRKSFEHRLTRVLDTARRRRAEHALCYVDLDQFKVINDTCGHLAGDELLRQVGALLPASVRKRDTLSRLGGDEFGVLMEHCSLDQAFRVARLLHRSIGEFRFSWEGKSFKTGASIGLVPITETSDNVAGLLKAADAACYAAKDAGRNRIHIYQEDDVELARRQGEMQWVTRICQALEEHRLHLCCQPIVPVDDCNNRRTHYELLLRMTDEDGNIVMPGVFLPAAERFNLATLLDRWVVKTAFAWMRERGDPLKKMGMCTINLSGQSLGDSEFLEFVAGEFADGIVCPQRICFEVTETAAIANLGSATRFITALRSLGCLFALDDFGSGLSSFAYLKTLPVDFLKIDGVFVKDIENDPIDLAMVKSINEIGQLMNKRTIAEFVETPEILQRLRDVGVDYAQGYGIGRPLPITEMP